MSTVLYDPIKAQSKRTDSVIVAFSGGKESVVVCDLCHRYFKNVKMFFMYICPDLSFQEKTLEWYEKKYQTEIIRIPHMDVSEFFHYGSFRAPDYTFPIVSINDIYKYVRLKTDIWWIAAGERINDSIVRRAMMKKSLKILTFPMRSRMKRYLKKERKYLKKSTKASLTQLRKVRKWWKGHGPTLLRKRGTKRNNPFLRFLKGKNR